MEKVKWGILGTAEIARVLTIPAMNRSNNADFIAIASISGKEVKMALEYGISRKYNNYEDLLDDTEIDAVYIPLPNHLHSYWVKEAAKRGKHVLCEKPAALSVDETKDMIEVCRKNNVIFMETFMYQYHPQNQRVRDIIASGEIGNVKLVRANCSFNLKKKDKNFRLTSETGGGSLYDIGCYCIHSIRNILKIEPINVFAKAHYASSNVDISATGILDFEEGIKGVFECSMEMAQYMNYEVVGTKGIIQVPRAFRPDLKNGEGILNIINENGASRKELIQGDEYKLAIENFSDCVLTGSEPLYTPENTINNMAVLDACFKSLSTGKEVEMH